MTLPFELGTKSPSWRLWCAQNETGNPLHSGTHAYLLLTESRSASSPAHRYLNSRPLLLRLQSFSRTTGRRENRALWGIRLLHVSSPSAPTFRSAHSACPALASETRQNPTRKKQTKELVIRHVRKDRCGETLRHIHQQIHRSAVVPQAQVQDRMYVCVEMYCTRYLYACMCSTYIQYSLLASRMEEQ